jgi:allantoin racemase
MGGFRLGLINPNTSAGDTAAMARLARAALGPEADVLELTASDSFPGIEGEVGHVAAAAAVLDLVRGRPDLDAYLIGCYDDPALHAARELTSAPVVGIGEAALMSATLVARRFAVVTTLRRGVAAIEDGVRAQGLVHRCAGVVALERAVDEQRAADAEDAIVEAGRRALADLGAHAIVLACGAMAASADAVAARLAAPVCDGVAFGALLAHALWRTGLGPSPVGAYAFPPELAAERAG